MRTSILTGGRRARLRRCWACDSGQTLLEFAMVAPLVLLLLLGVIEVGYVLLDQHVVTKLTREGSNLISRDTSLTDAVNAMKNMASRPVNLNDGSSKIILSVVRNMATPGANNGRPILYQRYEYGSFSGASKLNNSGGSFGGAPDFVAANPDTDTRLQITNLPATTVAGDMLYVTEIYSRHPLITPFAQFGVTMPSTLYSIAYF